MNVNETRLRYAMFHGAMLGAAVLGVGLLLPILSAWTVDRSLLLAAPLVIGAIHACLIYTGTAPGEP